MSSGDEITDWNPIETAERAAIEGEPVAEAEDEAEIVGIEQVTNRAYRNGDTFFVRSSQTRGKFYIVAHGACSCPGFGYRHSCNHVEHLEKAGLVRHDTTNGGYVVGKGEVGDVHRATRVSTGHRDSLAGEGSPAQDAQIRRLQALANAQHRLVMSQRRLISVVRSGVSLDAGSAVRMTRMIELQEEALRQAASALRDGDLVELTGG